MLEQSGVIPYRIQNGEFEVLLITSSKRKRWSIPKGWISPRMSPADSAAKEAKEEAGILGSVHAYAIGAYHHHKWGIPCRVSVFLMRVETILDQWDEAKIRKRQWLSLAEAIKRVKKTELKRLLSELYELSLDIPGEIQGVKVTKLEIAKATDRV